MTRPPGERVTERLRLRPLSEPDLAAVVAINTDPRTNRHSPTGPPTPAESEALARQFVREWERDGIGCWVVEYEGDVVGTAGVRPFQRGGEEFWNLHYRFTPGVWGRGLAAEATREAIAAARQHAPDRLLLARTRPTNAPAARLARAVGMRRRPDLDADGFIVFCV
jgi:RimJ/RimL family protein N-acetyltransferase